MGSSSIVGYGVPNYVVPDPNPPTYSNLTANKTMIAIGEEITFTASSDYATGFTIGIDNEVECYLTQGMENGKLTLSFDKSGSYGAYVTSYNSIGYADIEWIGFTVYDSSPTYSKLTADKTAIAIGEKIKFTASSDYASEYWIGIDNKEGRYLTQNMPDGCLTVTFDTPGEYSAYVTSSNKFGGKDSTLIEFVVSSSIKGDVNNDGKFAVADAVLLQKWLLGVPDAKLEYWQAADLCKDGRLDAFDMIEMRKLIINSKSV